MNGNDVALDLGVEYKPILETRILSARAMGARAVAGAAVLNFARGLIINYGYKLGKGIGSVATGIGEWLAQ